MYSFGYMLIQVQCNPNSARGVQTSRSCCEVCINELKLFELGQAPSGA